MVFGPFLFHPALTSQLSGDWTEMWASLECFKDTGGTASIRPLEGRLITPLLDERGERRRKNRSISQNKQGCEHLLAVGALGRPPLSLGVKSDESQMMSSVGTQARGGIKL